MGQALVLDDLKDYSHYVEQLIGVEKSPVLIYAGEFDALDGPATQEHWLRRLVFDGSEEFWSKSRQIYWVDDPSLTTDDS